MAIYQLYHCCTFCTEKLPPGISPRAALINRLLSETSKFVWSFSWVSQQIKTLGVFRQISISGHLTSYQDDSRAQVVKAYAVKAISQQRKKILSSQKVENLLRIRRVVPRRSHGEPEAPPLLSWKSYQSVTS